MRREEQAQAQSSSPVVNDGTGLRFRPSSQVGVSTNSGNTIRLHVRPNAHIELFGPDGRRLSPTRSESMTDGNSSANSTVAATAGETSATTAAASSAQPSDSAGPTGGILRGPRQRIRVTTGRGWPPTFRANRGVRGRGHSQSRRVDQNNDNNDDGSHMGPSPFHATPMFPVPPMPHQQPPPLEPKVLPDPRQDIIVSHDDLEEFKCCLCCEYMTRTNPPKVHDGCKANSRFCAACVKKFREGNDQKCPTCRNVVVGEFESDKALLSKIDEASTVRCRYAACDAPPMPLSEIAKHEAECLAVKVSCRYSRIGGDEGCKWIGPKKDLDEHERNECFYARVSGLVHQHLTLRQQFNVVQARTQASFQMQNNVLQQQVQQVNQALRHQQVSTANPIHVIEYLVSLFTNTLHAAHRFRTFETPEGKACIFNQLMLVPLLITTTRYIYGKLSLLSMFRDDSELDAMGLFDILASSSAALMGSGLTLAMFWLDRRSSVEWREVTLPKQLGTRRHRLGMVVSSLCAEMLFGLIFLDMDASAGIWRTFCFYIVYLTTSLFLPLMFAAVANPQTAANQTWKQKLGQLIQTGRASTTIHLGLIIGWSWGPSNAQFPEAQLILMIVLLFSCGLNLPPSLGLSIVAAAVSVVALIDLESLFFLLLSSGLAILCQGVITIGIAAIAMTKAVRPRSEMLLMMGVFGWFVLGSVL